MTLAPSTLYYNGVIVTMTGESGTAESTRPADGVPHSCGTEDTAPAAPSGGPGIAQAVLAADGRILAVGTLDEVRRSPRYDEETTIKKDLQGACLLPAFLDPHSHITAVAQVFGYASLAGTADFAEIAKRLSDYKKRTGLKAGEWLIGVGYDHNFLKEQRHPDRFVLDEAFPDNPVMLSHASGHMGVVNSRTLALLGITAQTKNPEGGLIGRVKGGEEPDGYLEENAFSRAGAAVPRPSMEKLAKQMSLAEELYLKNGITTIQDGITRAGEWQMLKYMAEHRLLHADVVSYADMKSDGELLKDNRAFSEGYKNHLRLGGYKIFLDGSPQGRTAWMSVPYEPEDGRADEHYCGYPIYPDGEVERFFERALGEGRQLLVHCNGDAAAEQMIRACEKAAGKTGRNPAKIRPVMIHAQLVREDQLRRMAQLSVTASFFTAHTYYWGDIHLKNFGRTRAMRISPARTAIREGVNYTFHQDSPVIEPNMIETIWCAVNRRSRDGVTMGELEKLTPYEALRAVTINAAYQYGEEKAKGTIEPGKNADFVILDQNPFQVQPMMIRGIRVLETIKGGMTLYRAKG